MAGELLFNSINLNFSSDIKGNFVRLPSSIIHALEQTRLPINQFGITLQEEHQTETDLITIGWDGLSSLDNESIDINPLLLNHNIQKVNIRLKNFDSHNVASEVYIEPLTSNDWEIIEKNSTYLQDNILSQTRFVELNKILICYINNTLFCKFKVKKIMSDNDMPVTILSNGTLIIVSPLENKSRMKNPKKKTPILETGILRSLILKEDDKMFLNTTCFINKNNRKSYSMAKISIIENPLDTFPENNIPILVNIRESKIPQNQIGITTTLYNTLSLNNHNGYKIKIEYLHDTVMPIDINNTKLIFKVPNEYYSKIDSTMIETFVHNLSNDTILTDKMHIIISDIKLTLELVHVKNNNSHIPFIQNTAKLFNSLKFEILPVEIKLSTVLPFQVPKYRDVINHDLLSEITNYITLPMLPSNSILIEGKSGMGKTTLLKDIMTNLTLNSPCYIKYIDCNDNLSYNDKFKLEDLVNILDDQISISYWYAPAVIILDNADFWLMNTRTNNPDGNQNKNDLSTRLSLQLISKIAKLSLKKANSVRIILSATSQNSLNSVLIEKHFISKIWTLKPPSNSQRAELCKLYCENHSAYKFILQDGINYTDMSLATDGYSSLDIKILIDRLYHRLQFENDDNDDHTLHVTKETFETVVEGFTPSSLRGVHLTKVTGVKWDDIGALFSAKRLLLETLEWPTKYSKIFENCPLRLRSGILLYGYAGCGKTLLASAVAQQCGLNFISIKGPEILNKYIGASEQSVRDLFEKAQSVKPCILFFDEFDSIAPKRGHDSTGVTDRIVNQLLTQMDGAEGLDGVYVLAATSRPDLIDPALLRPGRLDKSIICNLPNEEERLDILKAITSTELSSKKLKLMDDIHLRDVAQLTEGYSGADLQGLCYNAYLKSVHRYLSDKEMFGEDTPQANPNTLQLEVVNKGEGYSIKAYTDIKNKLQEQIDNHSAQYSKNSVKDADHQIVSLISKEDIIEACRETKPSISHTEFNKLYHIYDEFQSDRDGNMPTGETSRDVGTRSSLM